jgi:chromosome segregation ATPase
MRSPEQRRDAAPSDEPRPGSRRVVLAASAVLLASALVGAAIVQTQHDYDGVSADLQRVNQSLDEERGAVGEAAQRRRDAEAVLARVLDRLEHERSDRSDVRSLYEVISAQLEEKLDELESTSGNLELRARQLDQLNQCLSGVAAAMKLAAYDADSRVIESLEAVADVCASARGLTAKDAA